MYVTLDFLNYFIQMAGNAHFTQSVNVHITIFPGP
jgi:hypothetical protein